jgi:hypothetical protein
MLDPRLARPLSPGAIRPAPVPATGLTKITATAIPSAGVVGVGAGGDASESHAAHAAHVSQAAQSTPARQTASVPNNPNSETKLSKALARRVDKASLVSGGDTDAKHEQTVVKRVRRGSPKSARKTGTGTGTGTGTVANRSGCVPSRPIAMRRSGSGMGAKSAERDRALATETWDGVGVVGVGNEDEAGKTQGR